MLFSGSRQVQCHNSWFPDADPTSQAFPRFCFHNLIVCFNLILLDTHRLKSLFLLGCLSGSKISEASQWASLYWGTVVHTCTWSAVHQCTLPVSGALTSGARNWAWLKRVQETSDTTGSSWRLGNTPFWGKWWQPDSKSMTLAQTLGENMQSLCSVLTKSLWISCIKTSLEGDTDTTDTTPRPHSDSW